MSSSVSSSNPQQQQQQQQLVQADTSELIAQIQSLREMVRIQEERDRLRELKDKEKEKQNRNLKNLSRIELENLLMNPNNKAPEFTLEQILEHLKIFVDDELEGIESRLRVGSKIYHEFW